jgi:hypothetical protein
LRERPLSLALVVSRKTIKDEEREKEREMVERTRA